jgi:hypothetical protein
MPHQWFLSYVDWTNNAVRTLTNLISADDLDRLVLTRGHELLISGSNIMAGTDGARTVNGLVSVALDQRVAGFDDAIKALDAQIKRWSGSELLALLDSSFYIRHPDKLEEVDFDTLIGAKGHPICILVPMVVIDELDRLKDSSSDRHVRWRAGYTLAVIDRLFQSTTGVAQLHPQDPAAPTAGSTTRGEVTMELLYDPPGHTRLPINDDEIIDRALAILPLANRDVTLITYDTGQSTRARRAGLKEVKLTKDIGGEPSQPPSPPKQATGRSDTPTS